MTAESGKEPFRLGFLTAIEVPDRGFAGGLLVTNHFGRPLEFQCTAPLRPNRTQEILFGPTLVPYLLGDLIGRTLVEKVGIKPHIVLIEREDLLALRDLVSFPIAYVGDLPAIPPAADAQPPRNDAGAVNDARSVVSSVSDTNSARGSEDVGTVPNIVPASQIVPVPHLELVNGVASQMVRLLTATSTPQFRLGRQVLRFHAAHDEDRVIAERGAAAVPHDADLREPFERVREALSETARAGGAK